MKPNEYQCAMCGGIFEKAISDEQAAKEYIEAFGPVLAMDNYDVVCDDCYQNIRPDKHPEVLKAAQEEFKTRDL